MILYNTLIGVCAGVALILVSRLLGRLVTAPATDDDHPVPELDRRMWAVAFTVLGLALALLGGLMTTTWPLTANPPVNIIFGEPSFLLGLLLLGAALYLWRGADNPLKPVDLSPVTWIVFALGLVLAACAIAILRFGLIGGAPAAEPITGRLHHLGWIENTFFVLLYASAALGALLAPVARLTGNLPLRVMRWSWTTSGVLFLGFGVLNYYTHVGLLINLRTGTSFRW